MEPWSTDKPITDELLALVPIVKYAKSPKYFHNLADNLLQFRRYFPFLRGGISQDKYKLPYGFRNSAIALHCFKVLTPPTAPKATNLKLYLFFSYALSPRPACGLSFLKEKKAREALPCSHRRGFSTWALKLHLKYYCTEKYQIFLNSHIL